MSVVENAMEKFMEMPSSHNDALTAYWRGKAGSIVIDTARISAAGYVIGDHTQIVMAAQFRALRQRVFEMVQSTNKSPVSVIAITSAVPGEGKSFISLNLALSCARDKRINVTLIDYDLMRPRMSNLLDCESKLGLSDAMTSLHSLADVAYATDKPNLTFIPIGSDPTAEPEILTGQAVDALVSSLRSMTQPHVFILDCPPVLANEDAKHLAQRADLMVVVVKADSTPRHWTSDALQKIGPKASVALLLNGRTGSVAEQHYGYGATMKDYLGGK